MGAKDYYNNGLSTADYYISEQDKSGSFSGRLAERIGINGPVTKFAFDALCENLNPLNLKLLTPRKSRVRTAAYDLTACCPKSVSLAHAFAGDDHILRAFRAAVHDTMKEVEADAKTRVRKNGKDEDRSTFELIFADFIHQTARGVQGHTADPFLHAHIVIFNATFDPVEQRIKAVQFREIMRDLPYYESRFLKRLADNLREKGYRIRPTKNAFELDSISPAVISLFSKRKNEIEQYAADHNITDPEALGKLGAKTRAKKQAGLSMDALRADWKKQITAHGLQNGFAPVRFAEGGPSSSATPAQCVDQAIRHHFSRESVVQDRRLLARAYKVAVASDITLDQVDHAFKSRADILTVKDEGRQLCTTSALLESETRMIRLAHAGKGLFAPLYAEPPAMALQGEQAEAARHVLMTGNQLSVILGSAGTGKTTLMRETVALIKAAGKDVVIVAPTAQAARGVLRQDFADAQTVAKLLVSPDLQRRMRDNVLWVDEASLLGLDDMLALLDLAHKQNARLILGGDIFQHNAVASGDSLRLIVASGVEPVRIKKIHRQRTHEYRDAVQNLARGDVAAAFDKIDKMGAIKTFGDNYRSLAKDYMVVRNAGKTALVVSPTHAEGEAVTAALRSALRHAGKLGVQETAVNRLVSLNLTDAEKADGRFYDPGHVLQFNKNWRDIAHGQTLSVLGVNDDHVTLMDEKRKIVDVPLSDLRGADVYRKTALGLSVGDAVAVTRNGFDANKQSLNNGQLLTVLGVDKETITAGAADGATEYRLPATFGHLRHAYCMTSYSSQSVTVDEVFIAQNTESPAAASLKQFYVSCSRGRDRLHIYTDNKEVLLAQVSQSGNRMSAMELTGVLSHTSLLYH